MKKIAKKAGLVIIAAVVVLGVYAGYLFLMTGQWYSMEAFTNSLFEEDLKASPSLTITEVSGGYLSWSRTVKLSNGKIIFFHRNNNPSAWKLEPGQKIAIYVTAKDAAKEKSFCGAYEKR